MRIIGGSLRGLKLNPPPKLPVRPTKDNAREALFNILNNQVDFSALSVLDLFSGTGALSLEFASRGVPRILSVDRHPGCTGYLKDIARQHKLESIKVVKADVLKFLREERQQYDLIFADPPYDLPQITDLAAMVFDRNLLKPGGTLIIEHPSMKKLNTHPAFREQREYGYSSFSFFGHPEDIE